MPYDDRKMLMQDIEELRDNRTLICLCNFDRTSIPPFPGLSTQFHADLKECLYRILKESPTTNGLDIFLYTRGGDANSVWPIACLLHEFDSDFEVLVPFRAHSAGTMLSLAAKKIVMTRLAELSPIDPTTGNNFNPIDPSQQGNRLGISVEDVRAYQDFLRESLRMHKDDEELSEDEKLILSPFIQKLVDSIHPLALGNVHRTYQLVARLAKKLLKLHEIEGRNVEKIVCALTVDTYSHLHMIGREEAVEILGSKQVLPASDDLETKLDALLKRYEEDFQLRSTLFGMRFIEPNISEKEFRFIGGVVESRHWGYVFETKGKITQFSKLSQGVNVQIPPGQPMPLVPGLPRELSLEISEQRWHRNTVREGVTL